MAKRNEGLEYTNNPTLLGQGFLDLARGVDSENAHYASIILGATVQKYLKQPVRNG